MRFLGVQATPAEGAPSANVTFTALVVDESGPVAAPIAWDFCTDRNPLANLGPVNPVCLQQDNPNMVPIGSGSETSGTIPAIACRQFGPEVPEVMGNETPGRPVDPDATDYLARYHLNVNPAVASLVVVSAGGAPLAMDPGGAANTVAAGQSVDLEVAWPSCPLSDTCGDGICGADESLGSCMADCTTAQGCTGAERYVNFDLSSQGLVDAREGMHVSWFATGGSFGLDRTGTDGSDTTTTSDNTWQAPGSPGTVHMWVVLHDDRGGIGWGAYTLQVQ